MFGFDKQVARQQFDAGAGVGQDDRFAGACGQTYIDDAVQDAFGGGDVATAGAGELVDAANGLRAIGQGCDGLRATDAVDFVRAAQVGCHQRGRVNAAIGRGRRADHDTRHPRDAGRGSEHVHDRGKRALAARHVQANRS